MYNWPCVLSPAYLLLAAATPSSRQTGLQYEFKGYIQDVKLSQLQKQVKKIKIEAK